MKRLIPALFAGLLAASSFGVHALPLLPDVAVGITGGSAGIGAQLTTAIIPFVNVRAQFTAYDYSHSFDKDGIDYRGKLKLFSAGAFVDVYPFTRGPRLSAGLIGNGNKLKLKASCPDTCNLGDLQVTGSEGRVDGKLDFRNFSPYLGIGLSNPMAGLPFYLGFDAGVMFHGRPKPSLSASGTATVTDGNGNSRNDVDLANDPEVQAAVRQETSNLADDVKDFRFYPVVQLSLGWRF